MLQPYIEDNDVDETECEIPGNLSRSLGVEFALAPRVEISVDVHSQLGSGGGRVRVPVREHRGERALSLKLAAEATTATIVANLPCSRPGCQ